MKIVEDTVTVNGFTAKLTGYILDNSREMDLNRIRPTILVLPGGGYSFTSDREAEPVAIKFSAMHYQTFVLRYSCYHDGKPEYPTALGQAFLALKKIRENAAEWHVDPDNIAVMGFSAGGHLAADVCCEYTDKELQKKFSVTEDEIKPNMCILGYPVINAGKYAHEGSIKSVLGSQLSDEMREKISLENRVTEAVPPTFVWHTYNDMAVPVYNTLNYILALKDHNVLCECHIFPFGRHGLSLADPETGNDPQSIYPEVAEWVNFADRFMKQVIAAKKQA